MRATLSADTANFEQGMRRAQRQAQTSSSAIGKSLGVVKAGLIGFASSITIGMLTGVIKEALDYAGGLGEVAQQLGLTTRDLQNFRAVAAASGISTEEMDKAMLKLRTTLGQVAAGAKAPTAALAAIGITAEEIRGMDTGEAFRLIADGLSKVSDSSQRAAVEVALFGRTGAKLDTVLAGGSASINELADANERLGGVLSDEQIQNADKTADKLGQLQLVLKTQISGVVADNADAILSLANALSSIVGAAASAIRALNNFQAAAANAANTARASAPGIYSAAQRALSAVFPAGGAVLGLLGGGKKGPSKLDQIRSRGLNPAEWPQGTGGAVIPQFLASGGGGSRKKGGGGGKSAEQLAEEAERKRIEALRDAYQFEQESRRASMDVLRAQRDLSTSYVERTSLSIAIQDLEDEAYTAELAYKVSAKELTQAQADELQHKRDHVSSLERQAITDAEEARRAEDYARLDALTLDLQRDVLESEGQLAETAKEQRDVQLRLLDLFYKQERQRLEAILADKQATDAAKEEARRRMAGLGQTYANDKQGVINGTRGPLEQYMSELPSSAAKMEEALQGVAVRGFGALEDSIIGVIDGTKSLAEAFRDMASQILSDLIRISIQKMIIAPLANSLFPGGKVPGFATGGSMMLGGIGGVDRNMLSMNGVPIARVSRGERLDIVPQGGGGAGGSFTFNNYARMSDAEARRTGMQAATAYRAEIARSAKAGY